LNHRRSLLSVLGVSGRVYPGTSGLDGSRADQRTRAAGTPTVPGARDGIERTVCGSVACGAAADLSRGSAERAVQFGWVSGPSSRSVARSTVQAGDGDLPVLGPQFCTEASSSSTPPAAAMSTFSQALGRDAMEGAAARGLRSRGRAAVPGTCHAGA